MPRLTVKHPVDLTPASLAAIFSAAVAALALFVNAYATWQAKRTRELQIFDRVFGNIVDREQKLLDAVASGKGPETLKAWRSPFLNTLEYLAFLINWRYLGARYLAGFFSDAITQWYETIFAALATTSELEDPKVYPELKAFYHRLGPRKGSEGGRPRSQGDLRAE